MPIFINNHYDRLYKKPALTKDEMFIEQEFLAESMVKSGLLRVSAYEKCNFVILPLKGGNDFLSFSRRELYEENLLKRTYQKIKTHQTPMERNDEDESPENKVAALKRKLARYQEVPEEQEIKLARLLVQAAHPVIIANMIYEGVNFYVSYDHTVSELLNVQLWQSSRYSSGLQSNDFRNSSVFVSCGGNPFFTSEESGNSNDGFNAMARLMIIAAQEIAHHADLIKNERMQNIGRSSANFYMNAPNPECEKARQKDIERLNRIIKKLEKIGVKKTFDRERLFRIQFKYRKLSLNTYRLLLQKFLSQMIFRTRAKLNNLNFVGRIKNKSAIAEETLIIAGDMMFNLEPLSPAYKNEDENIEKAIMCAEALARIPQQEIKWGKYMVKTFTPNMQKFFYSRIIPEELETYRKYFKEDFSKNLSKPKLSGLKSVINKMAG